MQLIHVSSPPFSPSFLSSDSSGEATASLAVTCYAVLRRLITDCLFLLLFFFAELGLSRLPASELERYKSNCETDERWRRRGWILHVLPAAQCHRGDPQLCVLKRLTAATAERQRSRAAGGAGVSVPDKRCLQERATGIMAQMLHQLAWFSFKECAVRATITNGAFLKKQNSIQLYYLLFVLQKPGGLTFDLLLMR